MKKMNRLFYILSLFLTAFPSFANADFNQWKSDFYQRALEEKISPRILDQYFIKADYLPKVIELDRSQPEFTMSFAKYMKRIVSNERILKARQMFKKHNRILGRVEELYGIPAHYLLAFWGIETNFGATKGNVNILDSLATLSFDERRREFFSQQLIALLKILQKEDIQVPMGSWAGAFGHFQFMPTTFEQYAVDEDADGRRDVIYSFDDAVASAANYLKKMGWNEREIWGRQVILIHPELVEKEGKTHPLSYWISSGVVRADGKDFNPDDLDMEATLILPEGISGPAFLTYQNFNVIKRWNRSDYYALAVGILADEIVQRPTLLVTDLTVHPDLLVSDVKLAQTFLRKKGFYSGDIDGRFGKETKKALKNYQKKNGLLPDGFLSERLLYEFKKEGIK